MIKSYYELQNLRKSFYLNNSEQDHFLIINENSNVLISVPHGVSQVRNGINKVAEIGSAMLGLSLNEYSKANAIFKTKNNFDDANFDNVSTIKIVCMKL